MKISVKNQGYIKNAQVEFPPGLTVLRGKSSQGKSTLIRAIEAAIFNMPSDYLISYGQTQSEVEIEYNGHTVKRCRDVTAKENKTVYFIDGEKYIKNGRVALESVQDKIGIREVEISKEKFHMAFSSAFGKPFLVDESPQKIFDFITFSNSKNSISDVVKTVKNDLTDAKTKCSSTEICVNILKQQVSKEQTKKDALLAISNEIKSLIPEVEDCSCRLTQLKLLIEKSLRITASISRIEQTLAMFSDVDIIDNSFVDKLSNLSKQIETFLSSSKQLKETEVIFNNLNNALSFFPETPLEEFKTKEINITQLNALLNKISSLISIGKNLSEAIRKIDELSTLSFDTELYVSLSSYVSRLDLSKAKELKNDLEKTQKELIQVETELASYKVCPLCGQTLCRN